jgi:putative ABC transport system ATP-binding protein
MSEIVRTNNVVKTFNNAGNIVRAVNDVTISIKRGQLTVLRGKSGSGKTTLINLIGTLDRPDSGEIYVCDEKITSMTEVGCQKLRRKNIGFIFQNMALYDDMTAFENVEFSMRIAGIKSKERTERAMKCLEIVGLADRAKHIPQELSGGERQRVAIARAIVHNPALILADEPTSQLDTTRGLQIIKLFLTLASNEGFTFVMSSHDPEIVDIAHKVYTLKDGELSDEL